MTDMSRWKTALFGVALSAIGVAGAIWMTRGERDHGPAPTGSRSAVDAPSDAPRESVEPRRDASAPSAAAAADPSSAAAATPVAPPGSGAVEVRLSGTGEPVAGLALVCTREPLGPAAPTHRVTTDTAGRAVLEGVPVGRWRARADDDYLAVVPPRDFVDVLPVADAWPASILVARGALLTGSVVDLRGEPVAGAKIAVRPHFESSVDHALFERAATLFRGGPVAVPVTSAADGRFALRGVPPDLSYTLDVTHPKYAPSSLDRFEVRGTDAIALPPIVLGEGGTIRVTARSAADGSPVAGAAVHAMRSRPEFGSGPRGPAGDGPTPAATSGTDGVATVPLLRAETYDVVVLAPGARAFTASAVEVTDARTTDVAATIEPGAALAGVVVDASGQPVAGALVEARRSIVWEKATTGADGRFRVAGLDPPTARVRASAPGFGARNLEFDVTPEDARIELRREASAAGQVVDRDGKPVAKYRLRTDPERSGFEGDMSSSRKSIEVDDPGGRFVVTGLSAGRYVFRAIVAAGGLGTGVSEPVAIADGASVDSIRVVVEPARRVRARVIDAATREPLSGARGQWAPAAADGVGPDERSWEMPTGLANSAGGDGVLDVDLPATAAALRITARDHVAETLEPIPAAADAASGVAEFDVPLSRGGTVTGTVRGAGNAPEVGATVLLSNERFGRDTRTDSLGSFTITGLAPGDYVIGWTRERQYGAMCERVPLTITGDETLRVDLGVGAGRGAPLTGRVTSAGAGVEGADVWIALSKDEEAFIRARSAADGEFSFPAVPKGTLEITARVDAASVTKTVEVDGATPARIELELPVGALTVTVVDAATSAPVPRAAVRIERTGSDGGPFARTDESGRAEFSRLEPGAVVVRVGDRAWNGAAREYAPQSVEAIVPERGAGAVEVRLSRGATLEGRVTGPDGRPAADPSVTLYSSEGVNVARSRSEARMALEGRYRVTGLVPGTYVAVVAARGMPALVVPDVRVVEPPEESRGDFSLPRGGTAVVRASSARGEPVRGTSITCSYRVASDVAIPMIELGAGASGEAGPFLLAPGEYEFGTGNGYGMLSPLGYVGGGADEADSPSVRAAVAAGETTVVPLVVP